MNISFHALVDGIEARGRIATSAQGTAFDIEAEDIDLASLVGGASDAERGGQNGHGRTGLLAHLRDLSGSGMLRARRLRAGRFSFEDMILPLSAQGGRLTFRELRGRFCGGELEGAGEIALDRGVGLDCELSAKNCDFGQFMREIGVQGTFSGQACARVYLRGRVESPARALAWLDGYIQLSMEDVVCQAGDSHPWTFQCAAATADMLRGVITPSELFVMSDNGTARGEGVVDLPRREMLLEVKVTPTLAILPPVRATLKGPLSRPEVTVHGMPGALLRAFNRVFG